MKRPGFIFSAWGYLWSLLNTLLGVLLILPYGAHSFRWHEGALTCLAKRIIGNPGAQTHGCLIFFANEAERQRADLRVHEFTHIWQAFVGGPLYALTYGLFFVYFFTRQGFRDWKRAYRRNPYEGHAYRHGDRAQLGDWGASGVNATQ